MDITVLRIKDLGTGFSVYVTDGNLKRGFSFNYNEGWEVETNEVPKYIPFIREELKKEYAMAKEATKTFAKIKETTEKKVFKEDAKKEKGDKQGL